MRFRIPADLVLSLGVVEFQKSLHTKDLTIAKRRCLSATNWFRGTMERLRHTGSPSKADLEAAARTFFAELTQELDQPRNFPADGFRQTVDWNIHLSQEAILDIDRRLIANDFDEPIRRLAERILDAVGTSLSEVEPHVVVQVQQLAARAFREQQLYFIHQLTKPAEPFRPSDALFADGLAIPSGAAPSPAPTARQPDLAAAKASIRDAAGMYLRKKGLRGIGPSQIAETRRLLDWLEEALGSDRELNSIRRDELREFRDDLQRVDVSLRGRAGAFRDRLTNVQERQVKSATYLRYWNAAKGFFEWCESEGLIETNPTAGLKIEKRKGEAKRTPEPFSKDELLKLFQTPLFHGYQSVKRLRFPGGCRVREGHWWAAILLMHTGLRAGELGQLLAGDFQFDAEIPHLKVREEDEAGHRVKTTKNAASIRDVPLHDNLLKLGLWEFVAARRKKYPDGRVFREFRLGTKGRLADGMTRFWTDYLKEFGLWKPGRATHVWRHTLIACLRANDVAEEDIAAFVGHTGRTVTAGYGGAYPLGRKAKTVDRLDYGFDVVEVLGGPYDPEAHHP